MYKEECHWGVGAEPQFIGYYNVVPIAESHNTAEPSVLSSGQILHIVKHVPLS